MYRADLLWHDGDQVAFEIECSSGTYVRSLVTELGDAYCEELERTAIGPFLLEDARPDPADPEPIPLRDALSFLPERALSGDEAVAVSHGRRVPAREVVTGDVRLTHDGDLLAIGEVRPEEAEVQPVVVFAPA